MVGFVTLTGIATAIEASPRFTAWCWRSIAAMP
jgi:hypothetical protein